ncbi:hypothetical protein UFOVP824_9 [uncultured Caudovirales phage]|uniref:Uncharacterized protein n=1 Tax=uncultured Caudovirales phage TaxID=2100421 RepID=A0A6J5P104_9CAUD|nr:hypothetical protein UFOVP824_9 [uncultured Caudovirales phage]
MRVRTSRKCFVNNCIREEGEVFEYEGPECSFFECLDESDSEVIATGSERRKPGRPRKSMADANQTA